MSYVIAVAGKGGTGKTTTTAMIIRYLLNNNKVPILAIDADPNSNLADSIGIEVDDSIGGFLGELLRKKIDIPQGMSQQSFLEMNLHQILTEKKNIDMLVMGCPEGPGCYCSANSILKSYFEKLSNNYRYVIIDNEAGMEHFSRKTTMNIDLLLFCSNYSLKGLKTVKRLSDLVDDLRLDVKERYLVVNQTPEILDDDFMKEVERVGIPFLGNVIKDELLVNSDIKGIPLTELPDSSVAVKKIDEIMTKFVDLK